MYPMTTFQFAVAGLHDSVCLAKHMQHLRANFIDDATTLVISKALRDEHNVS